MLTPWQRLMVGGVAAFLLTIVGVAGYMVIEEFGFFDAVYQTVTTITTAGFGEVEPLSTEGRAFTLALIIAGIVIILYVLTGVMQIAVEGELENLLGTRRARGRVKRLSNHYILCGFGRVGEEVAREFTSRDTPFVIVESNPEAIDRARRKRYLLLVGDATLDAVLREAGAERAACLLAASDSDANNTFIVLAARALNPHLFIVARAAFPEGEPRMRRAGADRVFSPYITAGRQMALSAVHPVVVEFIDTLAMSRTDSPILAEIDVTGASEMAGRTIHDVLHQFPSIVVLGLENAAGELGVGPPTDAILQLGDRVIVVGREEELEQIQPAGSRAPAR
jgi:voltage-gated potassium channel